MFNHLSSVFDPYDLRAVVVAGRREFFANGYGNGVNRQNRRALCMDRRVTHRQWLACIAGGRVWRKRLNDSGIVTGGKPGRKPLLLRTQKWRCRVGPAHSVKY